MITIANTFVFTVLTFYTLYRYLVQQNETFQEVSQIHFQWQTVYLTSTMAVLFTTHLVTNEVSITRGTVWVRNFNWQTQNEGETHTNPKKKSAHRSLLIRNFEAYHFTIITKAESAIFLCIRRFNLREPLWSGPTSLQIWMKKFEFRPIFSHFLFKFLVWSKIGPIFL